MNRLNSVNENITKLHSTHKTLLDLQCRFFSVHKIKMKLFALLSNKKANPLLKKATLHTG